MSNFSVPRYRSDIGSHMRIFLTGFAEVGIGGVLVNEEDEDIGGTKGEHVVVETVPLSAHHWKLVI